MIRLWTAAELAPRGGQVEAGPGWACFIEFSSSSLREVDYEVLNRIPIFPHWLSNIIKDKERSTIPEAANRYAKCGDRKFHAYRPQE